MTVKKDCTARVLVECLNGLNFFSVEASEDVPQACIPDSVKRLLEVYKVVEQCCRCSCMMTRPFKFCSTVLALLPAVSQPWP